MNLNKAILAIFLLCSFYFAGNIQDVTDKMKIENSVSVYEIGHKEAGTHNPSVDHVIV